MQNEVTIRFLKCHDEIMRRNMEKSTRQFAKALDTYPQSINNIINGERNATVGMITALIKYYGVSSEYLMTGNGDIFQEPQREDRILYVPYAAHAGYSDQFFDGGNQEDAMRFSIPGYNPTGGEHRCFVVSGDSMEPTLYGSDRIICSLVASDNLYSNLRDNYVYVVITHNEILVKRVVNKLRIDGTLVLSSDNDFYADTILDGNELKEVWLVNMKLSHFMPDPKHIRNGFYDEISDLKSNIKNQQEHIAVLNKSIEALLRKNR